LYCFLHISLVSAIPEMDRQCASQHFTHTHSAARNIVIYTPLKASGRISLRNKAIVDWLDHSILDIEGDLVMPDCFPTHIHTLAVKPYVITLLLCLLPGWTNEKLWKQLVHHHPKCPGSSWSCSSNPPFLAP
jgi:hypothetical protein